MSQPEVEGARVVLDLLELELAGAFPEEQAVEVLVAFAEEDLALLELDPREDARGGLVG